MHSLNQTYPKVCLTRVKCWLRLLSGWLRIAWHRQVNFQPNTPFAQVQIEVVAKEARCPALPPIKQKIETRSSPGKPRDHTPAGGVDEHQRPHVRSLDRERLLFTYVQVDEGRRLPPTTCAAAAAAAAAVPSRRASSGSGGARAGSPPPPLYWVS